MRRTIETASWLSLAIALLMAAAGIPQEEPSPSQASRQQTAQEGLPPDLQFVDVIDVQLVNVEVWVTDGRGRPVRGLTADDFEVLEDGEPVEISYFAEVQEEKPVLSSLERSLAEPEADAPAPPAAPTVEPNHLVIYFDEQHLKPDSRRRAIADLGEFLASEEVPPERVLILSQDQSLKTEATFGSTWLELEDALERLSESLPRGGLMASEKRLAIRELQDLWQWALSVAQGDSPDAACDIFLPRAVPRVEVYAEEARDRIEVTLDHLASAASFLTGIPGVKTLLFVSDALERAPGTDLMDYINDLCPIQQQTSMFLLSDELSQAYRRLTRHANANRVTIYALQTEGLSSGFLSSAEQAGGGGYRGSISFDTAKRLSEREGMSTLAAETGGRAIFNRNEFDAELSAMAREMSSYYSLAYEPTHGGDRGDHELEVRVRGGGDLEVRHRRGYRDKSADVQMTERLQGAVYLGLVDNPLGVRLGAGEVEPAPQKKMMTVPLRVLVPAEQVTFLPREGEVVAQLSVQVSTRNAVDQKGIFDHRAYRLHWKTPSDQEAVVLSMDLVLPPGLHVVAVGVRDDASRVSSFVSTTVELHEAVP
ncbi:MAG TPA: VWA domain-containing protein [Thermoanaerobaculia bacterium]|nr:VWA domain-containing protein [Thermoanaerobaculia bacterium]